jgi:hypothetical protein
MPLVNFSNLDFAQVKETLKDYLKSNGNFTDYDFEGSNLSTILDVLAYNTYITSYNANMATNEVFIDSATLRENVVALARNIGYVPRSRKAATATVSFFVDATNISPPPATITLKKGPVAVSSGTFANSAYVFSIPEDITVAVGDGIAVFDEISIYEGTLLTSNFTFSSRVPNQKFILPNVGVDTELLSVSVKANQQSTTGTKYSKQDSLFAIGSESKVYFLQEVKDEQYELIFGDGVFGKALEDGNYIEVDYIASNGDSANGVKSFSFAGRLTYTRNGTDYTVTSGISLLDVSSSATGGQAIESVASVKNYAPRIYASQNRALTANDYEALIPAKIFPETESITVFGGEELVPPQYGKVFISIKPRTGDFLSNLAKENIKLRLKKYAVAGIVPEILDLKYLFVEINSSVYYDTNLAPNSEFVSSIVQSNVTKYSESSELNRYGARFKYSKFLKTIDDSHESVTSNITKISIRRDLRVAIDTLAEYSIGFGNQFHIESMSGYNIKSSPIIVSGIDNAVYISDLPNSDRKTGSLFFFTVPTETSDTPTIVKRNVGTIDYEKGVITLNAVTIQAAKLKDDQSILEFSATPHSNDVIGLQDLYLQLDINNSNFDMVVDNISSGLDPSASNYTTTSSYSTGSLVRSGDVTYVTSATTPVGTTGATTTTYSASPSATTRSTTSTTSSGSSSSGGY